MIVYEGPVYSEAFSFAPVHTSIEKGKFDFSKIKFVPDLSEKYQKNLNLFLKERNEPEIKLLKAIRPTLKIAWVQLENKLI